MTSSSIAQNIDMATRGKGIMLTCPSDFEQFGQGVSKKST
jgi:hypothetical protein